jgi:colanic acid/amylovoran biosynthesis glycosyltransferase
VKILTVGRLVEKKGHAYAIHAIARLAKDFPDLSYVVAGEGPLRKELERLADELGVGGRVDFLGAVDGAKVLELYRDCHIFLLPSVTAENRDREGQALVLQEAQVAGMPVVSTLHNGIPEGVLDGVSGYLVPEKDVELLTVKLKYLLEHTEIWPELGRAGRAFVEHRYDTPILTARLLEIYRGMLEGERL